MFICLDNVTELRNSSFCIKFITSGLYRLLMFLHWPVKRNTLICSYHGNASSESDVKLTFCGTMHHNKYSQLFAVGADRRIKMTSKQNS